MRDIVNYILGYLLEDEELLSLVGYTSKEEEWSSYKVVILPSIFFGEDVYGTERSIPVLPLREIDGVPVLYGTGEVSETADGGTKLVSADLVASAYYLMSRYEEWLYVSRGICADTFDEHGRMKGRESTAYKAGILERPIIQEYGRLLRELLEISDTSSSGLSGIYLTHDVDNIAHYRTVRGFCGGIYRSLKRQTGENVKDVLSARLSLAADPAFTYEYMMAQDARLRGAKKIYFVKAGDGRGYDYPQYNLYGPDFRVLKEMVRRQEDTHVGLHASYKSVERDGLVGIEARELENAIFSKIRYNRYHYLRTLRMGDYRALIKAGVEEDFTMGYADVVGYRLGTCQRVRWIDPEKKELTNLVLHPLTVMDATLSREEYMGLNEEEAYAQVVSMIDKSREYGGDVVLLWHNTSMSDGSYHKRLYKKVIDYLCREY